MGYYTKGVRVPYLEEAVIFLGLARGGGGSKGDVLGGYEI